MRFGQFCEQMNAVEERMHSPQCWQRNNGTFIASSKKRITRDNRRSAGVIGRFFGFVDR